MPISRRNINIPRDYLEHQIIRFLLSRYMFEGLGHMMSMLIISAAPYIKKMNANGTKKM